jgi:hypothetical protein
MILRQTKEQHPKTSKRRGCQHHNLLIGSEGFLFPELKPGLDIPGFAQSLPVMLLVRGERFRSDAMPGESGHKRPVQPVRLHAVILRAIFAGLILEHHYHTTQNLTFLFESFRELPGLKSPDGPERALDSRLDFPTVPLLP